SAEEPSPGPAEEDAPAPEPSAPEAVAPERRAAADPLPVDGGAPALATPIRLAGRAGLYAEGRALLDSLASAPEPVTASAMPRAVA
ncbi:MAG TPA: hypothetical protein VK943_20445, partial [Arenibaculum sp.]|nr:hypothetical protein [Arenibaculum sp.]